MITIPRLGGCFEYTDIRAMAQAWYDADTEANKEFVVIDISCFFCEMAIQNAMIVVSVFDFANNGRILPVVISAVNGNVTCGIS